MNQDDARPTINADFDEHNQEVRRVWDAYEAGEPYRVPMMLGTSPRIFLSNPALNTTGITYEQYHNDVETMIDVQLKTQEYRRSSIIADHEMGLPDQWFFFISGGNFSHSAWYGCEVFYSNDDSPDTRPLLTDSNKHMLFDRGLPDPFGGLYGRYREMHEQAVRKIAGREYLGRPINPDVGVPAASTMGNGIPFTTACKLRGTAEMCADMLGAPGYAIELLTYITEAKVAAISAWREYLGHPKEASHVQLGDDSVVLLSPEMYREMVLPFHRRIYEEFGTSDSTRGIHLCGAAQRHFPTIVKELGVTLLDTGFPLDIPALYDEIGEDVRVQGGVRVELLRSGTPGQIRAETRRILDGARDYKRFVLRDANLLAPGTPPENCSAMYEACREFGTYGMK